MKSYEFLLFLAIILISTKVLSLFSKKVHMPAVVGALLAGIILGPSVLDIIRLEGSDGQFIEKMAEIGVILLMFNAGLETDLSELKKNSRASFVTAFVGVIVPLFGGFLSYALYFKTDFSNYREVLKAVFIGVILTATSVSITVETLRELGKLKGKVGTTILGAAILDDIMGIVVLTVVTSLEDSNVNPWFVCGKILVYFIGVLALAWIISKYRAYVEMEDNKRRTAILSLAFCFILAYVSECFFGIADITGAYFAGLMLCSTKIEPYVVRRMDIPSYLIFSPVFFASIGIKTSLDGMNTQLMLFSLLLLIIAMLTKMIGCGIGAKLCRYTSKEAIQIGIGMISRGEVALIVAQKGYQYGLLEEQLFAPIVFVVIATTLITPILLKFVMKNPHTPVAAVST